MNAELLGKISELQNIIDKAYGYSQAVRTAEDFILLTAFLRNASKKLRELTMSLGDKE
jgi:hypothetical protein